MSKFDINAIKGLLSFIVFNQQTSVWVHYFFGAMVIMHAISAVVILWIGERK